MSALLSQRITQTTRFATVKPRVLHLINSFETGGTERQAVEFLKNVDRKRYDIRVAALRNEGSLYQEIAGSFPTIAEFRFKNFYSRSAATQLRRLIRYLRTEEIDILHAHDFYAGLIGGMAGRLAGVRTIAAQRHLKLSDRSAHRWGTRAIHRMADRILVNSEAIRDYIVRQDGADARKIVVVRNGISSSSDLRSAGTLRGNAREALCLELDIPDHAKLVGVVARLQPVKGHRFIIEAAERVIAGEPDARFVFAGDGPLRNELEEQAQRLGIREFVHFLGERTDVSRLMNAFDLLALASIHEGLPNAVMEAMAAGVPVIATAVGGTLELIEHRKTGYLVEPANSSSLAAGILFALGDLSRDAIAAAGRRHVLSRFGIERMVDEVQALYDELWSAATRRRFPGRGRASEVES
jgi:L-malate glycosyltransferase